MTWTETCESQVRLVFHFGRTNMGPKSKRTPTTQQISVAIVGDAAHTTEQSEDEARENAAPSQTAPTKLDPNTISAKTKNKHFFCQKHMCSLLVVSSLMCWTILKTIQSEIFLRQQCLKVDRRLEDPTVPNTVTILQAKQEFIETWDDRCLLL